MATNTATLGSLKEYLLEEVLHQLGMSFAEPNALHVTLLSLQMSAVIRLLNQTNNQVEDVNNE